MTSFRLGVNTGFATNRFVQPDDWTAIVGETLGVRIVQFAADKNARASFVRSVCFGRWRRGEQRTFLWRRRSLAASDSRRKGG